MPRLSTNRKAGSAGWSRRAKAHLVLIKGTYSGGLTPKSNSRFADSAPGPNAPEAAALMNAYSPGLSGAFGTTLYTPGAIFVDVNGTLALSSVPEEPPKAFIFVTTVSRVSLLTSKRNSVNSLGVLVPEDAWP